MSFDRAGLTAAIALHGRVARIVITELRGSAPREAGAAMLVWAEGQSGTIGGGTLEWEATARARAMLAGDGTSRLDRIPLGPSLGQCCGGAVTLVTEVWGADSLSALPAGEVVARPVGSPAPRPLAVQRLMSRARAEGAVPPIRLVQGWLVEPVARPARHLWIWGAGHVGRAIVATIAPLPDFSVTWVDTDTDRFPDATFCPEATRLIAPDPAQLVAGAPQDAEHLILTYSHALDLELCHRLLLHGFVFAGLIGSQSKWARFRSRLTGLGHPVEQVAKIHCPIGDPTLGKHPQAIAVGVVAQLIRDRSARQSAKDRAG